MVSDPEWLKAIRRVEANAAAWAAYLDSVEDKLRNVPGGATPNRSLCDGSRKVADGASPYQQGCCAVCGGYYMVLPNGRIRNHYAARVGT